jgi:hypothetical protein
MNLLVTSPPHVALDWSNATPPAPGWYVASTDRDPECFRYWTGAAWSAPIYADRLNDPVYAARALSTPGESQFPEVEWCAR